MPNSVRDQSVSYPSMAITPLETFLAEFDDDGDHGLTNRDHHHHQNFILNRPAVTKKRQRAFIRCNSLIITATQYSNNPTPAIPSLIPR